MPYTDVGAAGNMVIQIASKIQELGNNWYKASADLDDFPRKVEQLRRKHEFWKAEFSKFGMLSDAALVETLHEAESLLVLEQAKLEERQAKGNKTCCIGYCPKLSMIVFPARIGLSIQSVISAFDTIPDFLKLQEDAHAAMQRKLLREPHSLDIREDAYNRHVHLGVSEFEVCKALENPDGPNVVLLHGGAGKGKSTLARYIALLYQKVALFDHIFNLECGPKVQTVSKQLQQLLQCLGCDMTAFSNQGEGGFTFPIPTLLQGMLKYKRVLIIFDDVWDGDFLQEIVNMCGKGVRCLVTSQNENLCKGLNFRIVSVKIQVEEEDARKILASHAGLSNQCIPANLEGLANRIVQETEMNPLALALIGREIDYNGSGELETWEAAQSNFFQLLHSNGTAHVLGDKYSRSFFAAMKLSIQQLSTDAQKLLALTHLCSVPSVPQEVVHILYRSGKFQEGSTTFERLGKELESRELLKISLVRLGLNHSPQLNRFFEIEMRDQKVWSLHSLQSRFIEDEMKDKKESILSSLAGCLDITNNASRVGSGIISKTPTDEDTLVQIILCALYLHSQFAEKVASKTGIPIERFDTLKRNAIEPVTRLLGQPVSDRWTAAGKSSAKQVFLRYICNGGLHNDGITLLLAMPISTLPILFAVLEITLVERTISLDENISGLFKVLVHLLRNSDTDDTVKRMADLAICRLFRIKKRIGSIGDLHPDLQVVAEDLPQFFTDGAEAKQEINKSPAVMDQLINFLYEDDNHHLQGMAAMVLGDLAEAEDIRLKLVNFPGALGQLTHLLSKDNNPDLQLIAAYIFAELALTDVHETKLKIIHSPGALQHLIEYLREDSNDRLQQMAAVTLYRLSTTDETRLKIVNFPGALEQLTHLLSDNNNTPDLQGIAAQVLRRLALTDVHETRLKIIHSPGALSQLIQCLWKDNNQDIQAVAVGAMDNLAKVEDTRLKIVNFPGALERLTHLLSNNNSPNHLQFQVALVFGRLALTDDHEIILKLIHSPYALSELIKCLWKDNDQRIQASAVLALRNLAKVEDTRMKIVDFPGALEQLVHFLSNNSSPDHLQLAAGQVLHRLALTDVDETKLQIIRCPGILSQLIECLWRDNNKDIQVVAVGALNNLATVEDARLKIVNLPDVLERLTQLLSNNNSPNLQLQGHRFLRQLFATDQH